ncbi:alpha/beta hydrolase [Pedobacter sp. PAMC26386]|nr:alpha/beta hydrolase [Pedobacter sp. PAMC26386]
MDPWGRVCFEQDADDVAALLVHLHIPKVCIIGFSNGVGTALQVAIRHPGLVDKLVVISGMYKREDMYPWFWEMMEKTTFEGMPSLYKEAYLKITPSEEGAVNDVSPG